MAVDKGWHGAVTVGGDTIARITEWTLDAGADVLENTAMGDTYDRSYVVGLRGPNTLSFSGYRETTDTGQYVIMDNWCSTSGPSAVTMELFHTAGATEEGYTGSVILTGFSHGAAVDGLQTFSGNGQFASGKLSTV
jgi:hypothetical protein